MLYRPFSEYTYPVLVFGWQMPDAYWYYRLRKVIFFEFNDLEIASGDVDWQFVCLESERLLKHSHQLLDRQHILEILEETKRLFFEAVG